MTDKKQAPEPGIYRGIAFDEYLSWDAVSNSSMTAAERSLLHYKEQQPIVPTRSMLLGTLTHTAQFEDKSVNERFAFRPDIKAKANQMRTDAGKPVSEAPWSTSEYKQLAKEFDEKARADGKEVITEEEFTALIGMSRALSGDKRARGYLEKGLYEVSIVAVDPVTGLKCKGRLDYLNLASRTIADLKTTDDASDFEKKIARFKYHRQLAFYADMIGWIDVQNTIATLAIVAIENTAPHGVRSGPLCEEAVDQGRKEYRELLDKIALAVKSRKWSGYEQPESWKLPAWAMKQESEGPVSLVVGGKSLEIKG